MVALSAENECIFSVDGAVHFENVVSWRLKGEALLRKAPQKTVCINFAHVTQADSAILSLMLCWLRLAHTLGITLRYLGVPKHILVISELYGIKNFLPLEQVR